jgi:hypothetical protein
MTIRTTSIQLLSATSLSGPVRVTRSSLLGVFGHAGPVRVTAHFQLAVASVHNAFITTTLESDSAIYGITGFDILASVATMPDPNPYRPEIPEQLSVIGEEYYNFASEQQQTLREQHNLTQAGDTTFPYQMILLAHETKQFTLGSVGRFYHEDYGLIQARYVQFDSMIDTTSLGVPVGLFKSADALEWVVTNRFESSDPSLVVGVLAQIKRPSDSEFGWVIVDGPNLQEVRNESTSSELGEAFSWSATGAVSTAAQGRIIGRRVNKVSGTAILPGQMQVALESWSLGAITVQIETLIGSLADQIEDLQGEVETLKALTSITATFQQIQITIKRLTDRIATEERARQQAVTNLNRTISNLPHATASQLGAAVSQLSNSITAVDNALSAKIRTAQTTAADALRLAQLNRFDPAAIEGQIAAILNLISGIEKAPKGKFPIVDGSVPPSLVYLDDGSLVYVETF